MVIQDRFSMIGAMGQTENTVQVTEGKDYNFEDGWT